MLRLGNIQLSKFWGGSKNARIFYGELGYWFLVLALLGGAYWKYAWSMIAVWRSQEEYSHGFFIPLISLYLLWKQRSDWQPSRTFWLGLFLAATAVILLLAGELATVPLVVHYGLVTFIIAAFGVRYGDKVLRQAWMPLVFLYFMIPLPRFLYHQLSLKMQLWSSKLGVGFIELCRIPVYLEGNVIDLGLYQLQVAEACNGLRYLFPLFSLSFLFAYLYRGPLWHRWLVFLSAAPWTVLLNSFRIGVIGLLVNRWGTSMAEGFLHYFEGWLVFMVCVALLLAEIKLLAWLNRDLRPIGDLIALPEGGSGQFTPLPFGSQSYVLFGFLAIVVSGTLFLQQRQEVVPDRVNFLYFPMTLGKWQGVRGFLEPVYLNELKPSDYILADYTQGGDLVPVNFYAAYYQSQRTGVTPHSPRTCIPGGGWEIQSLERRLLDGVHFHGRPLLVNRLIVARGEEKQLVYYWFQQRGRNLASEYLVKWFLFYDALTRNRTDGALVRLVSPVSVLHDLAKAERKLQDFAKAIVPLLPKYIPD